MTYKSAEINLFYASQGQRSLDSGKTKQSIRKPLYRPTNIPFKDKNTSFSLQNYYHTEWKSNSLVFTSIVFQWHYNNGFLDILQSIYNSTCNPALSGESTRRQFKIAEMKTAVPVCGTSSQLRVSIPTGSTINHLETIYPDQCSWHGSLEPLLISFIRIGISTPVYGLTIVYASET